jgi:hypothetical protein
MARALIFRSVVNLTINEYQVKMNHLIQFSAVM